MKKENRQPIDSSEKIEVEIGSKAEVLWTRVKKEALILIEQGEDNLIIQRGMLKLAESKIKEEQAK